MRRVLNEVCAYEEDTKCMCMCTQVCNNSTFLSAVDLHCIAYLFDSRYFQNVCIFTLL